MLCSCRRGCLQGILLLFIGGLLCDSSLSPGNILPVVLNLALSVYLNCTVVISAVRHGRRFSF